MHRFFVSPQTLIGVTKGSPISIEGEVAQQISRVLRMRPGDEVLLLDGRGYEYRVGLLEVGKEEIRGEALGKKAVKTEPAHAVDLYLSLLNKPDKFEWALQKCTELGAARFAPVMAERSVAGSPAEGKYERWERIIREAAEQSGRGVIPPLEEAVPLEQALAAEEARLDEAEGRSHLALIPALGADMSLPNALNELEGEGGTVSIFIGPEGGFTDDELQAADEHGILLVSLGPRTLRAETAAVAALTIVMYELDEC